MRKKNIALRDCILEQARVIAYEDGVDAINIRLIAKKADISVGTIYNYFSNKDEIILELTKEFWKTAIIEMMSNTKKDLFYKQIEYMFIFLNEKIDSFARVLMNSLGTSKTVGKEYMKEIQLFLQNNIIELLNKDSKIRKDIWSNNFTKEKYAEFIIINLFSYLRLKSPDINFFVEMIRLIIY